MTALARFCAPHYVAGAEFDRATKRCVRAAPIIKWMRGKHWREVKQWCERKGVVWEVVRDA